MKTRKEIDEAIEGAEYISGMGSFIGLGGEPLKELVALARLGASVAEPSEEEIEAMAKALYEHSSQKLGRLYDITPTPWDECNKAALLEQAAAALLALKDRANV